MSLKVFYLDDEPGLCEIFFDLFSSEKIQITTFSEPETAIKAIKENPPDLLFIDYRLPNTTGDEVALKLNNQIPKFLITGDIFIKTKYNFEKIFSKPYDDTEIQGILDRHLSFKNN